MRNIFTVDAIRETATYKEFVSKNQKFKIDVIETRATRERITNAFCVWRNIGNIPNTLNNTEMSVLTDLIAMQQPK